MKLFCNFNYMKELCSIQLPYLKYGSATVHIYEYSVKRFGYSQDSPLILYMVCKANKDGYAKDKDIQKGFYTLGQAVHFAENKYMLKINLKGR